MVSHHREARVRFLKRLSCFRKNLSVYSTNELKPLKAWPNARNISTQHLATLLGTTCCVRLATLLRYVAMCCNMLHDVGSNLKTVKFFVQHFGCCMMLYFGHVHEHCCARACALGPLARYHSMSSILIFGLHPSARGLGS